MPRSFAFAGFVFLQILLISGSAQARDLTLDIKLTSDPPAVLIKGRIANPALSGTQLSFLRDYAGIQGLADRFSEVEVVAGDGRALALRRLMAGEFTADRNIAGWSYTVSVAPLAGPTSAAHVSWITSEHGLLMLDDLLPQFTGTKPVRATIAVQLPDGWKLYGPGGAVDPVSVSVDDIEKAVFVVGRDLRSRQVKVGDRSVHFVTAGIWHFSDDEAAEMVREITQAYTGLFSSGIPADSSVVLLPFPGASARTAWEAETRGTSITIISGDMPFKTQSLQRLHEQLRHEIFHLWVPGGLSLTGRYDWFYEGVALYSALKAGVRVNRIRFEDLLDTLSRAHSIDSLNSQRNSLIDASKRRWTGGSNTHIYARGMLVAFLSDVLMMTRSKGKRTIDDLIATLYREHRVPAAPQDGNAAVLDIMSRYGELQPIVERYIKGSEQIDWRAELRSVGIDSTAENYSTKLTVVPKPNGRQREFLDKLGYNSWRKISADPK